MQGRARLRGARRRRAPRRARAGKELADIFFLASDYCRIGRYPVANTPGKKEAYHHSRAHASARRRSISSTPLQIVEVPFQGKKLVGYLTDPEGRQPSRRWSCIGAASTAGRRTARDRTASCIAPGSRRFTVDMPGTGEHPLLYGDPAADQDLFGLDRSSRRRAATSTAAASASGAASFGAYWAARLAYVGAEAHQGRCVPWRQRALRLPARLAGARASPPAARPICSAPRAFWKRARRRWAPRRMEEFLDAVPKLSLKDIGPDRQAVGADPRRQRQARRPGAGAGHLLPAGARLPKEARIYPQGRHMGRSPGQSEDEILTMITNWLKDKVTR